MKKPELLAPAGDLEKLKIAIIYGADAVFIGGKEFSLRSKASNFTMDDIKEAVTFAHLHHARVHITVNVYPHNEDLEGLEQYLIDLDSANVDAIIVSSPFIIATAKRLNCHFELHLSTQQSIANVEAINFWADLGINRVVLAREETIEEIEKIKESTNVPIEVFIHGGMCSGFSGRCTLSNYLTLRDANRGGCAHSCRWYYDLYTNSQLLSSSDKPFRIGSKDLMAFESLKDLIDLGTDSLKIEGRMKSIHYVASIVSSYRYFIDYYYDHPDCDIDALVKECIDMARKAENRDTSTGFLKGQVTSDGGLYENGDEIPPQDFIGIVCGHHEGLTLIEQRNYFQINQKIEIIQPHQEATIATIKAMYDINMTPIEVATHAMDQIYIDLQGYYPDYAIIRKAE